MGGSRVTKKYAIVRVKIALRNYNNRFIHSDLDWRLALDVAEIVLGIPINKERWLARAQDISETFVKYCENIGNKVELHRFNSLFGLVKEDQSYANNSWAPFMAYG